MDAVSLTSFVDFVSKAGSPKLTVVKKWKTRGDYDPATDFYKPIREQIVDIDRHQRPLSRLDDMLASLTHKTKIDTYPALIAGYGKWHSKNKSTWFEPVTGLWSSSSLVARS